MHIQMIPLTQLVPSPANVRKTGAKIAIPELAASIAAHGLLQNLQVRAGKQGQFEVVAGARRLAALKLLAKRKTLPADTAIGCNVLDTEQDAEISLAENEGRLAMHPADQFDAFKALIDAGRDVEEIAARFGVTPLVVKQRLKLASVSPALFALYRADEMKLDQLMAFTVSDDFKAQEAAWFDAPDWNRSAAAIRRTLTAAHVTATDRRAVFVTIEAYVAAGGQVIADLFQTERYLTDAALLDRLVTARLEQEAATVRQEGWRWVEIIPDLAYDTLRSYGRAQGKPHPRPAKDAKQLAMVEKELDALSQIDALTDEEAARAEALEAQIATLTEPHYQWSNRQMARGGAVVSIGYDGALAITRGLIAPADMKEDKKPDEDGVAPAEATPAAPGLSAKLAEDLTAHRTLALRAVLADAPSVALAVATLTLALPVFYHGAGGTGLALRATSPALHGEGIEDCPAARQLADRHAAWASKLPEHDDALWDWLLAQDAATVAELMAYCVALTIEPVRHAQTDRLAAALSLDMAQWWQPTATSYFGRVSKTRIIEAVTEAAGANAANGMTGLKKDAMAKSAEALLAGTGWLPSPLRAA